MQSIRIHPIWIYLYHNQSNIKLAGVMNGYMHNHNHERANDCVFLPEARSGVMAHQYCAHCGLVKDPFRNYRAVRNYVNAIRMLIDPFGLKKLQIRLIVEAIRTFEDPWAWNAKDQDEYFLKIMRRYTRIPDVSIMSALNRSSGK